MVSGNPAKKAAERKISGVGDFKKRVQTIAELPSGMVVKLRNPGGLQAFISGGDIPNSLMVIIQKALKKGQTPDIEELMGEDELDKEMLAEMMGMMDSIAVKCMIEPNLQPAPETEEERSDDLLYVDELPDDDKQFIFSWLTSGVTDLETFRKQRQSGVDAVVGITSA